ncbi:hypothetical protein FRAHR75_510020 [Frankia sp. Hr75.2]|nr:hypothetical protein FRAHR75_510020 [Frankia sp. Hr75.2]
MRARLVALSATLLLVLGDLVAILHPDALPGHDFAFYKKIT